MRRAHWLALRGRGSWWRALGRLAGSSGAGLQRARSGFIGWGGGGGAPEGARFCGGHGGNRSRLPESEKGRAGWVGWGRQGKFLRLGDAHGAGGDAVAPVPCLTHVRVLSRPPRCHLG